MPRKRTLFIGDIHGCFDELMHLLKRCEFDPENDRLISLGDLMHKGWKSAEVLDFFIQTGHEALMGNHDHYFLETLRGEKLTYDEYDEIFADMLKLGYSKEQLIDWFEKRPYYIEGQDFIAVHAGLDPRGKDLKKQGPDELCYMRYWHKEQKIPIAKLRERHESDRDNKLIRPWYKFLKETAYDGKSIFYGHWAKKDVAIHGRTIGLDTGSCYGGKLSAYILEEECVVQVDSEHPKQFDY